MSRKILCDLRESAFCAIAGLMLPAECIGDCVFREDNCGAMACTFSSGEDNGESILSSGVEVWLLLSCETSVIFWLCCCCCFDCMFLDDFGAFSFELHIDARTPIV